MPRQNDGIYVRSHVARDLLQSASLFKTDKLVVWEYVSNGLQYVDSGTNPVVRVTLDSKKKRITFVDNGRGMDIAGLKNFFVMHGENVDRKQGRVGVADSERVSRRRLALPICCELLQCKMERGPSSS